MGYPLRRQLRDALGPDISGLQRAVALEIADDANDDTRESWVSLEDLARWTAARDVNVVRTTLKRLAAAGWEFRVPLGVGKDGRVLFAVPGKRLTFKVPPIKGVATVTPKGEPPVPLEGEGVTTVPTERTTVPCVGTPVTPFSSFPQSPQIDLPAPPPRPRRQKTTDDPAFAAFWDAYPKKTDKDAARRQWKRAVADGADPQAIITGAKTYADMWAGAIAADLHWAVKSTKWLADEMWNGTWPIRMADRSSQRGGAGKPITSHDDIKNGNVTYRV